MPGAGIGQIDIEDQVISVEVGIVQVEDAMSSPVITVGPEDTLADVARVFSDQRIRGAPVVDDDGNLVGVISEADLIAKSQELEVSVSYDIFGWVSPQTPVGELAQFRRGLSNVGNTKVKAIMTKKVVTVSPRDSVEKVAQLLAKRNINRVPVMDGSNLVGIISRADVIRAIGR